MSKSTTDINFDLCCRICLVENGSNLELFPDNYDEKVSIPLKIMTCAQVQVMKNDGLPQQVCGECTKHVDEVCEFLKLIKSSDFQLRNFLKEKTDLETRGNISGVEESKKSPQSINDLPLDIEPCEAVQNEGESENPQKIHTCDECLKSFKTLHSLRTHKSIHKGKSLKCPKCDKIFAYRRLLLQHRLVHTNVRSYLCPQCNKSFKTKPQLKIHCRRHLNERPFKCDYCDKKFYQVSHRNQHLRLHTNERPYSCDMCGRSFRNQSGLKGHMQKHSGVQPYQCDVCGKKFSLKSSLINHGNLHSGEKLLVCEHCGRSFGGMTSLKFHLKTHLGGNGCESCGKKFSNPVHLEEHKRTHGSRRDFVCSTCGKTFKQSAGLTMHMKTHNPQNPYECDLCEKSFKTRQTFQVHYRRHTGSKPYKCDDCGKCFRQSSTLKTHSKLHKQCNTRVSQPSKHEESCEVRERTNSSEVLKIQPGQTNNQSALGLTVQIPPRVDLSIQDQPP